MLKAAHRSVNRLKKHNIDKLGGQVQVTPSFIDLDRVGALESASNSDKGFLHLPVELRTEILDYFPKITVLTRVSRNHPVLDSDYLERTDVLRSLSQVCVAYRQDYLALLWETTNACCATRVRERKNVSDPDTSFSKQTAETLARLTSGLILVLSNLAALLQSLPNLHTLHILHTHSQMGGKILEEPFQGVTFPNIRTLIIQGYCHHILSSCTNTTTLWCVRDDGRKLVAKIEKHCKLLQEVRGFDLDKKYLKKVINAAPNLRAFDVQKITSLFSATFRNSRS
ncbi:hypothetical protein CPB84DRAFT_1360461 [Gymnopilus junonius]|uniref:Uncharacterized protein n=1 Tax=Gymnopilus junonius TaxID=109634 RepID=A0A9P5TRV5_GYMJU|nr:hypothetical protein CPB84DRAFT_1360461 [Gymnopilus junonius]